MGIRNVLLTTGYPAARASYADATSVFDVDAIGLVNMVARLNQGLDIGGQPIGAPTAFHVGVAFNPFAPNDDTEWRRLMYKLEAGAEFVVTPPIFDVDAFEPVLAKLAPTGLPVIAGLAALEGLRHAEFLASEVVGVRMPDALLDRLRQANDQAAEALAATLDIARRLRPLVQGLQITTVHAAADTAVRLLSALREHETGPDEARIDTKESRHA